MTPKIEKKRNKKKKAELRGKNSILSSGGTFRTVSFVIINCIRSTNQESNRGGWTSYAISSTDVSLLAFVLSYSLNCILTIMQRDVCIRRAILASTAELFNGNDPWRETGKHIKSYKLIAQPEPLSARDNSISSVSAIQNKRRLALRLIITPLVLASPW